MVQFLLLPHPPGTPPRGLAIFSSIDVLFPTPGHAERDNFPGWGGGGGGGGTGMVTARIEPCIIFGESLLFFFGGGGGSAACPLAHDIGKVRAR